MEDASALRSKPNDDGLSLIPKIILSRKCGVLFMSAVYTQVHFRLDFIIEANTMNPNQSDLRTYCLQYRLPQNISR